MMLMRPTIDASPSSHHDRAMADIARDSTTRRLLAFVIGWNFLDIALHIAAGEVLMSGGSSSGFVYIPFSTGLRIFPLGGYAPVSAQAWVSLGDTGVVRGSVRNATIVAAKDVTLLMIPKSVYLEHWYDTYSPEEFARLLSQGILSKPILSG